MALCQCSHGDGVLEPLEPHIEAADFIKPTEEKLLFTHRMHGPYMDIIDTFSVRVSKIPWTRALKMSQHLSRFYSTLFMCRYIIPFLRGCFLPYSLQLRWFNIQLLQSVYTCMKRLIPRISLS